MRGKRRKEEDRDGRGGERSEGSDKAREKGETMKITGGPRTCLSVGRSMPTAE